MMIVLFTRKAELQAIFFSFDCSQRCFNILARNNRLANYHFYFSILTKEKYCCSLHQKKIFLIEGLNFFKKFVKVFKIIKVIMCIYSSGTLTLTIKKTQLFKKNDGPQPILLIFVLLFPIFQLFLM